MEVEVRAEANDVEAIFTFLLDEQDNKVETIKKRIKKQKKPIKKSARSKRTNNQNHKKIILKINLKFKTKTTSARYLTESGSTIFF